jgi:predicted DNA-binding antitoxin AbrB/MazE fold protein
MAQVFEAIYENGVIRPNAPLIGLSEGQRVWVTIDDSKVSAAIQAGIDDMEAGRVIAFDEVDRRLRARLGLPPHS